MKRKLSLLLVAVMVLASAFAVSGCKKKRNYDVSVWLIGNPEQNAYYETMFARFGEQNDIVIEFKGFQHFEWETQIMKGLTSSTPPDVFQVGQDEIAFFSSPANDIIMNLKDYIQSDAFQGRDDLGGLDDDGNSLGYLDIQDSMFNSYRYNGTKFGVNAGESTFNSSVPFYGFSTGMICQTLGYNVALLKQQISYSETAQRALRFFGEGGSPYGWPKDGVGGITLSQYPAAQFPYGPPLPWELDSDEAYTLETFMTIVRCVANYENRVDGQLLPIYGMDTPDNSWQYLSWAAGSEIFNPSTGKIVWADSGNINGMASLLDWVRLGRSGDKTQGISRFISSSGYEEWINQQIIFYTQIGSWESQTYSGEESNFTQSVEYMPVPVKTAGAEWKSIYSSSILAVHQDAPDKDKAMKVASVFYTRQVQEEMIDMGMMFPMYKSTYDVYTSAANTDTNFPKARDIDIMSSIVHGNHGRIGDTVYTEDKQWWTIEFKNKYSNFVGGNYSGTATAWLGEIAAKMQTTYNAYN